MGVGVEFVLAALLAVTFTFTFTLPLRFRFAFALSFALADVSGSRAGLGFRSTLTRILFEPIKAVLLNIETARLAASGAVNVIRAVFWRACADADAGVSSWDRSIGPASWKRQVRVA